MQADVNGCELLIETKAFSSVAIRSTFVSGFSLCRGKVSCKVCSEGLLKNCPRGLCVNVCVVLKLFKCLFLALLFDLCVLNCVLMKAFWWFCSERNFSFCLFVSIECYTCIDTVSIMSHDLMFFMYFDILALFWVLCKMILIWTLLMK